MLYLNSNSKLTVVSESGTGVVFDHISQAEIKESVKELGDTATIVIPRQYGKIRNKEVLKYLHVGDKVELQLGYNGEYHTEFKGYLREIGSGYPVNLYVDDELYPLRKNSFNESWKSITLRKLLNHIAGGYKIECPDVDLGAFQIDNASTLVVLRELKRQYGFYSFLKDDTLHCQFAYDVRGIGNMHTYNVQKNVKKTNLKYSRKEDYSIQITAISTNSDGTKTTAKLGSTDREASQRTLNFRNKSESELRELAQKELDRLVFDGFTGSIIGYGHPRVHAGDTIKIVDSKEPERDGSYLVEDVTIRYGKSYFERICKLSYKI